MAEYIEREKALEDFDKWIDETGAIPKGTSYYYECRACIEDVPSADVVEVVHGEWFLLDDCANAGVYCSVCHKKVYKTDYANQKVKSKYCPNCGAKMDGRKDV